jgi:ketosteroid isomerase-like protein
MSPAHPRASVPGIDRAHALSVLRALHDAQNAMYSGGETNAVRALLTEEIEWHVPGESAIAGDYHGIEEVVDYFHRRRALASNTLRLHPGEILVGATHVAVLTDGTATLGGVEHRWSTVGLYRLRRQQIAACWLLPLDQHAFDRAWTLRGR